MTLEFKNVSGNVAPIIHLGCGLLELALLMVSEFPFEAEARLNKNLIDLLVKQAQLGVPHSRIQVELGFILVA